MRVPQALLRWCSEALIRRAMRTPYFHLDGYMERLWLVPYRQRLDGVEGTGCGPVSVWHRPVAWFLQRLGIAIRIHHILRSDRGDAFHDHPWPYLTILLKGAYCEVKPVFRDGIYEGNDANIYCAGQILVRRSNSWHRLVLFDNESCWTLFITGRKQQRWGFLSHPDAKTYWREYVAQHPERQ